MHRHHNTRKPRAIFNLQPGALLGGSRFQGLHRQHNRHGCGCRRLLRKTVERATQYGHVLLVIGDDHYVVHGIEWQAVPR